MLAEGSTEYPKTTTPKSSIQGQKVKLHSRWRTRPHLPLSTCVIATDGEYQRIAESANYSSGVAPQREAYLAIPMQRHTLGDKSSSLSAGEKKE